MMILALELYKYFNGYRCWEYCYTNNIVYSYSELVLYEISRLRFSMFLVILFCYLYYFILIINIVFIVIFILTFIKIKKKGIIHNVFLYYPFLIVTTFKHVIIKKLYNRNMLKILLLNYLNIILYGSPRLVLNYSFITVDILRSYSKNPIKKINLYEILEYIYNNTYGISINKMEDFLKYPI